MGTLRGVDRAEVISEGDGHILYSQHDVRAVGVYIGGPYDGGRTWEPDAVKLLEDIGFEFWPLYVGQNLLPKSPPPILTAEQGRIDGNDAVECLKKFGWPTDQKVPIINDTEVQTFESDKTGWSEYQDAWNEVVNGAGSKAGLYGNLETLDASYHLPNLCYAHFLAWWIRNGFDNSLDSTNVPGWPDSNPDNPCRGWQYAGSVTLTGLESPFDLCAVNGISVKGPNGYKTPAPVPTPNPEKPTLEKIDQKLTLAGQALASAMLDVKKLLAGE